MLIYDFYYLKSFLDFKHSFFSFSLPSPVHLLLSAPVPSPGPATLLQQQARKCGIHFEAETRFCVVLLLAFYLRENLHINALKPGIQSIMCNNKMKEKRESMFYLYFCTRQKLQLSNQWDSANERRWLNLPIEALSFM